MFHSYLHDITVAKQESNEIRNKPLQTLLDEMLILKRQNDKKDGGKTICVLLHSIYNKLKKFYLFSLEVK